MSLKRIIKEMKTLQKKPLPICTFSFDEEDPYNWEFIIKGPVGSPYEGGKFKIRVTFPENYPNSGPSATFVTPIYHANINEDGKICLEIWDEWVPTNTVSTLILALYALLDKPNRNSAYRGNNYGEKEYLSEAKRVTLLYAIDLGVFTK